MKKSWKKGIAAAMSVLLAAGMAGCGQTNTANRIVRRLPVMLLQQRKLKRHNPIRIMAI